MSAGSAVATTNENGKEENMTMAAAPKVQLNNIHKAFGDLHVLRGVDLEIGEGEVCVLIGPSGSGKSTLLRCINQLEEPTGGKVLIDGELQGYQPEPLADDRWQKLSEKEISAQRSRISMVFQRFNLFPHMTALENVCEAPIHVRGVPKVEARAQALELLKRVGLGDRADHYPSELSGGQQQRVAIARALAMEPEIMLFDEPTSALDPELVAEVLQVLKDLAAEGQTMVVVTHEIAFAREVADHVVFMDGGQAIEAGAPSEVLDNPCSERLKEFLASVL